MAQNRFIEENNALKQTISSLEREIFILKDTTQSGQLQREYDELNEKYLETKKILDNLKLALEEAIADRDVLANKVMDYEDNIEQIIEERIHSENIRTKKLETEVKNLKERIIEEGEYYQSLEDQVKSLSNEVDELQNWKSIYEAGHGLQHISRNQKKLIDDNRRLTLALEQRTEQVSVLMDANNILSISFEKLKKECGKSEDFFYPELQLHEEVQSITISLQLQIKEFQLQIDSLENENTRLRKALRDQVWAGNSTFSNEKGFQFSGFTPDLLVKVNEFALNLRDGKIELPLDDRSRQLLKENKILKEEINTLRSKLVGQQFDPTTSTTSIPKDTGSYNIINDSFGYNIKSLVDKSNEMQDSIKIIMEQIGKASSSGAPMFSGGGNIVKLEDLTTILSKNNEMILEELELMRRNLMNREGGQMGQPPKVPKLLSSAIKSTSKRYDTPLKSITNNNSSFNYWTPFKSQPPGSAQSSIPPGAQFTGGAGYYTQTGTGPMTPHGKQLASNTIMNMNLPPEEWTSDVKDLNLYLIEILEQLYEREYELNASNSLLKQYEDNLAELKLQLIIMYHDYNNKMNEWNDSKTTYINENKALIEERNDLKLRLNRLQDMINILQNENESSNSANLEAKLNELTRKIIMYEVNESILTRKYISLEENLKQEIYKKNDIIKDFIEMESTLKQRILFLETHKLTLSDRFNFIQKKLDHSVPQEDYLILYNEIENLREELLNTLKREVNIRSQALSNLNSAEELKSLRYIHLQLQADLEKVQSQAVQHQAELNHSNELIQRSLQAANVPKELSDLVSEMARYRGESTRLEVELKASNRRYELLNENYLKLASELQVTSKKLKEYELNESELENKNLNLRNEVMNLKLLYENGLTKDQKDQLTIKIDALEKELQMTKIELKRQTELSEIASNQAQTLTEFKNTYLEEIKELKEYCSKLESRSEDEVLIGRLQRQLMSMKASYKIFVRKYQGTRENLRRREIALRIIEKKLIETESKLLTDIEVKYVENNALKRSLRELKHTIVQVASGEANSLNKDSLSVEAQLVDAPIQYTKYLTLGMGKSILDISSKVTELSAVAEASVFKYSDKEEENHRLQEEIEKLTIEKLNYSQRLEDINALNVDDFNKLNKQKNNQNNNVALRLISLSEELRINKLSNIQNKRQISSMREEIKHLKINLAKTEHDLLELEKQKIEDEFTTKSNPNLSGTASTFNQTTTDEEDSIDIIPDDYFNEIMLSTHNKDSSSQIIVPLIELPEETIQATNASIEQFNELKKKLSEENLANKRLEARIDELRSYVEEKENQLNFYERVLVEENLQHIILRLKKGGYNLSQQNEQQMRNSYSNPKLVNLSKVMQEEQDRIQEIATITINNLKSMLDEKNILIERYRDKIDRLIDHVKLNKSYADKRAEELLNSNPSGGLNDNYRLDFLIPALTQMSSMPYPSEYGQLPGQLVGELQERCRNLQTQLESLQASSSDKDRTIDTLEKKLLSTSNQCERAELRCESSLREMEAMKEDMMTLVQQLSESENRCSNLTQLYQKIQQQYEELKNSNYSNTKNKKKDIDSSIIVDEKNVPDLTPKVKELEKTVKNQNDKIKGYREIIVRLKDEFMRVEEQQAEQEAELKALSNEPQLSSAEIIEIKDRVATLQEGIRNAKIDLEKVKKNRDKVLSEKEKLADEIDALKGQLKKTENQLTMSQNFANKLKNDLEESRKKESRLRAKLKEINTQKEDKDKDKPDKKTLTKSSAPSAPRIDELLRENELLRAQNAALMKGDRVSEGPRGRSSSPDRSMIEAEENIKERDYMKISIRNVPKGPFVLGTDGTGGIDEVRQDYHKKWEAGKNLQKRVNTLEERVQELIRENDMLTSKLHSAESSKNVKPGSPSRSTMKKTGTLSGPTASPIDLVELEQSRAKIFKLEEELQEYKRKAEVEQSNQIRTLKQHLSSAQGRIIELERELAEYEERRKKHASDRSYMRDEEEMYLREEKLRDEVITLRRNRLVLEADLLEKENRSIELQFEIEASAIEKDRLRRRVSELESFAKQAQLSSTHAPSTNPNETLTNLHQKLWGGDTGRGKLLGTLGGNNSTKKELELEGVIEAMKRVVEKLRLENERLKRGIGVEAESTGGATPAGKKNVIDYEKKYLAEKKKNEKIEEELSSLQNQLRSKNLDDNNLNAKLALKQQQINSLKKQIKAKEDEISNELSNKNKLEKENEKLSSEISSLQDEISNLQSQILKLKKNSSYDHDDEDIAALQAENRELKQKIIQLKQQKLHQPSDDEEEEHAPRGQLKSLETEIKKLKDENSRLKEELSAFDLEFFEEIENLKFNYTQALKKIQQYEILLSGSDLR